MGINSSQFSSSFSSLPFFSPFPLARLFSKLVFSPGNGDGAGGLPRVELEMEPEGYPGVEPETEMELEPGKFETGSFDLGLLPNLSSPSSNLVTIP